MISIGELNRLSRLSIKDNPRKSALPLLVLCMLSDHENEWVSLSTLIKTSKHPLNHNNHHHLIESLIDQSLIEKRKQPTSVGQFAVNEIRILPNSIHQISTTDYDYSIIKRIIEIAQRYCSTHSSTSPLVFLVLIAIYVRQLLTTSDVAQFCGTKSHTNIINHLVELEVIGLVKESEGSKSIAHIFQVEPS